jgi:uncharacterized protein
VTIALAERTRRDPLEARVDGLDWAVIAKDLDREGWAVLPGLLAAEECASLASLYAGEAGFRSRIVMARHGFGQGEYKYFAYPLPPLVGLLREALYPKLAAIANLWNNYLSDSYDYPDTLTDFLTLCHEAGQARPTPLLLQYGAGDYNCLHQDLHGALFFPLQAAFLLSAPWRDFTGGEFVLVENRPRMQSRARVVPLGQGDGVVFAVHHRPARGVRGFHRASMRHGVSPVRTGRRHVLGIIFHDAK